MTEEYLQVAFEIKATCDEISRRLLRWHWEKRPGPHGLDTLLAYIDTRRAENPEYYDHMPDITDKTSWQQLDTTVCMRVLLDPEKDAASPVDLLGNTAHPAAARRACNAVRTARNEAAHAADSMSAQRAAILFSEAVECLEEGYANSALRENELERYYRRAEDFRARLSGDEVPDDAGDYAAGHENVPAVKPRRKSQPENTKKPRGQSGAGGSGSNSKRGSAAKAGQNERQRRERRGEDTALAIILLLAVMLGLILRARGMSA